MTVNGIERRMVLEFLTKHQKSEAHFVKEWNRNNANMATELDEKQKMWLEGQKENARRGLVKEQGIIKEFANLLGQTTKHVDIRTPTDLLEIKQVELIEW